MSTSTNVNRRIESYRIVIVFTLYRIVSNRYSFYTVSNRYRFYTVSNRIESFCIKDVSFLNRTVTCVSRYVSNRPPQRDVQP